jgi:hypothetical protein
VKSIVVFPPPKKKKSNDFPRYDLRPFLFILQRVMQKLRKNNHPPPLAPVIKTEIVVEGDLLQMWGDARLRVCKAEM